jgi:DnaJ-class molecular chaperone
MSKPFSVRTLDDRLIPITLDQTITPQLVHRLPGEGMPCKNDNSKHGDMFIKFDVVFPTHLKEETRTQLIALLEDH